MINQSRNFPTHIAIEKIKSTDSEIRSIKTILKNKYKLTRQDIIECKEEAKLYYSNLNTHHKRLAYQETYYEKYIKHLGDNISSIPVQFIKPTAVKPSAGLFFFDNIEGEMSSVDTHENGSRMLTPKPIEPQHGSDSLISTVDTHAGEYSLFGPNSISFFDAIAKVIAMPEAQENGRNIVTPQPISPLNGSSFLNEA